jgi:ribokinase
VPRHHVIVVGSVNTDLVVVAERLPAPGETVMGGEFGQHGGGKGANQAVAAARLGAQVTMVGAVGRDTFGDDALQLLEREGIDTAGVARAGAATGVALINVDASGENQIAVAPGANERLDPDEVERAVRAAGRGVVLLSQEVPEAAVLAGARAAGGPVVLNPAPVRRLPGELAALGPILTPNAGEASALSGEEEPEAAARALAARTGAPVLVTLGRDGVLVARKVSDTFLAERLPAPSVTAVDTTGAGDTFNGALAVALAEGRPLRDAAAFAVAAAALSTRAAGAREGMPRRDEVGA